jgi:hypothetical protein
LSETVSVLVSLWQQARSHRIAQLILVDPPGDFTQLPVEVYEAEMLPFLRALETEDWRAAMEVGFNNALTGSVAGTRDRILANLAATPRDRLFGMYRGMFAFEAVNALDRFCLRECLVVLERSSQLA